jgi:hypothetical protein
MYISVKFMEIAMTASRQAVVVDLTEYRRQKQAPSLSAPGASAQMTQMPMWYFVWGWVPFGFLLKRP